MTSYLKKSLLLSATLLIVGGAGASIKNNFDTNPVNAIRVSKSYLAPSNHSAQHGQHFLNGTENVFASPKKNAYQIATGNVVKGKKVSIISRKRTKSAIFDEIKSNTGLKGWIDSAGVSIRTTSAKHYSSNVSNQIKLHDVNANLLKTDFMISLYHNGLSNSSLTTNLAHRFLKRATKDNSTVHNAKLKARGTQRIYKANVFLTDTINRGRSHVSTSDMKRTNRIATDLIRSDKYLNVSTSQSNDSKINNMSVARKLLNDANNANNKTRNDNAKTLNTQMINNVIRYYDTVNNHLRTSNHLKGERDTSLLSNTRHAVHEAKIAMKTAMKYKNNNSNKSTWHLINQANNYMRIAQAASNQITSRYQSHEAVKTINSIAHM